jgi:hypothetical protein
MEFALGFVIALAISLTGVGAGTMTTPLLILLLGETPMKAVGVALAFGTIVKVACVPGYIARRQVHGPTLRLLLLGGLPGVLLGAVALHQLARQGNNGLLFTGIGALIAAAGLFQLVRGILSANPRRKPEHRWLLPLLALPIGMEVGFSSAGAGALGSLLLLGFTSLTTLEVVGTDLSFGLVLSATGTLAQLMTAHIDLPLLWKLSVGGLCGVFVGLSIAQKIAQKPLRIGLLVILILLGCILVHQGIGNLARTPKMAAIVKR